MPSSCFQCNPCSGMLALFKKRPRGAALRRKFGKMKNRRHRASSFSSVRAVFWPLMSMRSDADRNDGVDRGPSSSTDSEGAVRAPSPSLDTPAASTTAARVLALQAQLSEAAALTSSTKTSATASGRSSLGAVRAPLPSPSVDAPAASTTTAARVIALQSQLGEAAALASSSKPASKERGPFSAGPCEDGDVEEACRSFEKHLMEMLVDEGKVKDLMDVEELLCCWEKLRSPVFVRLVGRFYGELCMDLFSGRDDDVSSEDTTI